ncbi:MAG: beta-lactamase class [Acidobacteriota bacterium]|nr:beta-lactamase class [Acidobacteriota bacterium]
MPLRQLRGRVFHTPALACALLLLAPAWAAGQSVDAGGELEGRVRALIAASGAEIVAVAFRDLQTGRELLINPGVDFHAASTMKVPVMLEVYREARDGRLRLDERLPVRNEFKSIADGSAFSVSSEDDSEHTLYRKIGGTETVRELVRLMITESSNLATNILIERVTPARVMELMRRLGARDIKVLRGVEDGKAFERGLNNTTTARDLLIILRAVAEGRAVSRAASRETTGVLLGQKFNEGIPAGLPAGVRVAHKTGSITKIEHDAAIVYPPGRRKPYVLVVLVRGIAEEGRAHRLIADISRAVYADVSKYADVSRKR